MPCDRCRELESALSRQSRPELSEEEKAALEVSEMACDTEPYEGCWTHDNCGRVNTLTVLVRRLLGGGDK